jgi:hypothetical protein
MHEDGGLAAETQAPPHHNVVSLLPTVCKTRRLDWSWSRPKLLKGAHDWWEVLKSLNDHFVIGGPSGQAVDIFRIGNNGLLYPCGMKAFKLETQNIQAVFETLNAKGELVEVSVSAGHWWLKHEKRNEKAFVFKPVGQEARDEYNLWRGYGVVPKPGEDKIGLLLDHIWEVICKRDQLNFTALMNWLRYAVQRPDLLPETIIVFVSQQGSGKSLLGEVMCRLLGLHAAVVSEQDYMTGRFNGWLAQKTFILGEEMFWAGDHRAADRLKSMATSPTLDTEFKFMHPQQMPNHLHIMLTTNHEHAVRAGAADRRFFVLDVSEHRRGDHDYFDAIHRDLETGGYEQFLNYLLSTPLGDHPRIRPMTAETIRQIEYSADSFDHWWQSCIYADAIIGGSNDNDHSFNDTISTRKLHKAYSSYCISHRLHPLVPNMFGKALATMFKPERASDTTYDEGVELAVKRRPPGYVIPDSETVQQLLNKRRGVARGEVTND